MRRTSSLIASLLLTLPGLAQARVVPVSPATLASAIATARGGDTLKLAPGAYGEINFAKREFTPALTLDASDAQLTALNVMRSAGVTLRGGTITVGNRLGYGISVRASQRVGIYNVRLVGMKRGIVIDHSQDLEIRNNVFSETTIDGLNIAQSQRVNVIDNKCTSTSTGKAHPDCYQGWSRPDMITTDIVFRGNSAVGNVQGIFFGNHVRNGVDDGGFKRITIVNNYVRNRYPHGIALSDCEDCTVRDNDVAALPGAKFKTAINVTRTINSTLCGNKVPNVANSPAIVRCR